MKIVIEDNNAIISVKNTYENAVIYENGEIQTTKIDTDEHGIGIKI
ncbi:MAG: GHKL domain-containing protein [Agathobacter rectalis]